MTLIYVSPMTFSYDVSPMTFSYDVRPMTMLCTQINCIKERCMTKGIQIT